MSANMIAAAPPAAASTGPPATSAPDAAAVRASVQQRAEDRAAEPQVVADTLVQSNEASEKAASLRRVQKATAVQDATNRTTRLDVQVDEDGVMMVKVRDARTDKVVREIPPEDLVEFSRKMRRYLGLLMDKRA
ncbi:MAG TPA: flagellar protein FlaG [Acidobacteriota bacterium]|nr:flagellar protein FlaG [Acidobacteriota bacterium]